MKPILLLFLLSFIWPQENDAQIKVNVNIGSQPVWGPTGHDYARFYYLPDLDMYYHVNRREYMYNENNRWVYINHLPDRYRNYDLFKGYKLVFKEDRPYDNHSVHINKYKGYKNNQQQQAIIYSKDKKYPIIKGYPGNNGNNGYRKWSFGLNVGALAPFAAIGGRNDFSKWLPKLGYGASIKYQASHAF